ncbi:MAG: diguanylate cyclase [Oscillospiraceae bacterium]|nr:diguanylate cyclase [Oscillospiraceae bacterium]
MQKPQKEKSIQTKLFRAVFYPMLLLALIMGIVCMLVVNHLARVNATHLMTQVCEREKLRIDNRLNLVSHSVSAINVYINEVNNDGETELFSEEYSEKIQGFALDVSNQIDGATSVFYRYNPELTGSGTSGFLWSRLSGEDKYSVGPMTDLLKYSPADRENVGWFYLPKESGAPMWMKPYFSANLGLYMISYVIPVYSSGNEFLGVVGMDIEFDLIMKSDTDIRLYRTGKIALVDLSERLIYSEGRNDNSYSEILPGKLYNHITTINKTSELLEIEEDDGSKSVICCRRLANGMIIYVNVPKDEIFKNRDLFVLFMLALTAIIVGTTMIEVSKYTSHIVKPINRLAEVTDCYARGDWSDSYTCSTGDELQKLSESIGTMANNTQDVISALNSLARTDPLTGLRNKTSYLEYVSDVRHNRHDDFRSYAVVVMDLNLLKKVNDLYGHEAGDTLIIEAGDYISRAFPHSAVFRIGGDEFAAILTNGDYAHRGALLDAFEKGMQEKNNELSGSEELKLSISCGMAVYPAEADDYDEVFRLADERMYEKKRAFKISRDKQGDEL